jgi:hypothetical protein
MALAFAAGAAGCATQRVGFEPIGALSLRVAAEQEADVVWILKSETKGGSDVVQTVLRCHNAEPAPICIAARVSQ